MEVYLFQSGIALLSFYILYWLFVRHRQNFKFNRIFVLLFIVISGVLPFLDIPLFNSGANQVGKILSPVIVNGFNDSYKEITTTNSISIFSIVYIVGLVAFASRSMVGLATLLYLYWRSPKKKYQGFTAVILAGKQSPFTFFNLLFISRADLRKDHFDELIVHEKAHRDQLHSIDLLIMELITIIHWFNPLVWLIKKDLKSEHEFLADAQVINEGFDKSRYQSMLLQSHEGLALYLANNFNYSILKKRLIMMTKQKPSGLNLNYVFAIPLLLLVSSTLFLNFQLNNQTVGSPDVLPEYKKGTKGMYMLMQKSIKYPLEARSDNTQGTVYISFTVNTIGALEDIRAEKNKYNLLEEIVVVGYSQTQINSEPGNNLKVLETEGERVVALLGKFNPGLTDSKPVKTRMTLPITFKIQ